MKAKNEHLQDWLNGTDKNKDLKENYFGFNILIYCYVNKFIIH